MAKEKEIEIVKDSADVEVTPERQAAWDAFLVKAAAHHPRQFAIDKEKGEFDVIPASFHG